MPAAIAPIAGAVVGGLMSDKGGGQTQTQNREPWKPAQQPLIDSIKKGQTLQGHYEQNPFNQLQQTSLQNLYGDIDNYRQSIAPAGMQLANRFMNSNYQRAPAGSELGGYLQPGRAMGGGAYSYGAAPAPSGTGQGGTIAGLLGQAGQGQTPLMQGGGLLGGGGYSGALGGMTGGQGMAQGQGPGMQMGLGQQQRNPPIGTMRANPGQAYGQLDFKALNPYTSGAIPEPKAPESNTGNLTEAEIEYLRRQAAQDQFRRDQYGYGDGGA